jgi:hypothetical protein
MQTKPEEKYQMTILTHEGGGAPFESTVVELLTTFFSCIRAKMQTYVLADNMQAFGDAARRMNSYADIEDVHLTLVESPFYKKECVQSTQQFLKKKSEVLFVSCHGMAHKEDIHPAGLSFHCPRNMCGGKPCGETVDEGAWRQAAQIVWART